VLSAVMMLMRVRVVSQVVTTARQQMHRAADWGQAGTPALRVKTPAVRLEPIAC